ncbi:hypothetical protein LNP04_17605 [Chryseobacterium sp. C-71]|uniref:hypothetical protein n=1 Tax=Chryseobacterium sp. C-71 TaxID=2893882 RepID=UPI001E5CC8F7|nr:hypothetical protein [Chryseobacterium sp. C-71]UFH31757.1 hypothetical protein LNP04_17605 [Chryseobacterium sp. C-71]
MRNLILPFLLILTLMFSCRSESEEVLEQKNPSYDVYVAGTEYNKACYWKNTIKTELSNGDNINTRQIIVENNNIYITGALSNNTVNNGIQYFWKNNMRTEVKQYLNIPNNAQYNIERFTVSNEDIYFAGYVENPTTTSTLDKFELCFWENGVKTVLYKSQYVPTARSIFVDGSDVYVSAHKVDGIGYFKNTTFSLVTAYYMHNFAKNSNGIYLLFHKDNKYYSKNLNTNAETLIGDYIHPIAIWGKIISHNANNDLYTIESSYGDSYFKNNSQISPTFSPLPYIQDMFILDNNVYMIKYNPNLYPNPSNPNSTYNGKVFINGVESQNIMSINDQGSFNSIFVIQN